MRNCLLVIDTDKNIFEYLKPYWLRAGIYPIRVNTMEDAIKKILEKDRFSLININSQTVSYLPLLPYLRKTTIWPIHVLTNNFSLDENIVALRKGADYYGLWEGLSKYVDRGLIMLQRFTELNKNKENISLSLFRNLFIFENHRRVFICSKEIFLTSKEYSLLFILIKNSGIVLTYNQIMDYVWGSNNLEVSINSLHALFSRLRSKLNLVDRFYADCIINIHNEGYCFKEK